MKETEFDVMVNEVIDLKMQAVEWYVDEVLEKISKLGNPEKLVGIPYEQWKSHPGLLETLGRIYGENPDTFLSRVIFNKEYDNLKELEREA